MENVIVREIHFKLVFHIRNRVLVGRCRMILQSNVCTGVAHLSSGSGNNVYHEEATVGSKH